MESEKLPICQVFRTVHLASVLIHALSDNSSKADADDPTLVELAELVFRRLDEIRLKCRARLWGRREVAAMPNSKIVFLLVLVAVCVTAFYVRLWMERRKSQERNRPIRD